MDDVPSWIIYGGVGIGLFLAIVAVVMALWQTRGPQSANPMVSQPPEAALKAASWIAAEDAKAKAALAGINLNFDPTTFTNIEAAPKWRMAGMAIASVILLAAIWWIARQQLGVLLFKGALQTNAAFVGYWIDRALFPDTRPHIFAADPALRWKYEMRRAVIVIGCLIGVSFGA